MGPILAVVNRRANQDCGPSISQASTPLFADSLEAAAYLTCRPESRRRVLAPFRLEKPQLYTDHGNRIGLFRSDLRRERSGETNLDEESNSSTPRTGNSPPLL